MPDQSPHPLEPRKLPNNVWRLLDRQLSARRQELDRSIVDRQIQLYEKLSEHIQTYLLDSENRPGRTKIFEATFVQARRIAAEITDEWRKIVWQTICKTLEETAAEISSSGDLAGLLDKHLWNGAETPFTANIVDAKRLQRIMDENLHRYQLKLCESEAQFCRRRDLAATAAEVEVRESARHARASLEIAIDRHLLAKIPKESSAGQLSPEQLDDAVERAMAEKQSERARHAANARHSQKGGYREKREQVIEMWKTGKYKTKKACALAAQHDIGISSSTAKNALRGIPHPDGK